MDRHKLVLNDKNVKKIGDFWKMISDIQKDDDYSDRIVDSEQLLIYKSMQHIVQNDDILAGLAVLYYKHKSFRTLFKTAFKEFSKISVKK